MNQKAFLQKHMSLFDSLLEYCQKSLGYNKKPKISFVFDSQNAQDPLGKTGYYDPQQNKVVIFCEGRHISDIMRSLVHECTHHVQNCNGHFNNANGTNEGYAQTDPHLRELERDAYERGNLIYRDWQDSQRQRNKI